MTAIADKPSAASSLDVPLDVRAAAVLIGLLLLALVDNQILSPILREIASSFGVSVGLIGATVSGYALSAAAAALVAGPVSDRTGRRGFLLGAGLAFALGSLTVFFSTDFAVFAFARVITGGSAGVLSALVVATIADRVPYERRGRAMSWVAAAYFAAPILLVPCAAWMSDRLGWRTIYVVFATAGALLVGAAGWWLGEDGGVSSSRRPDRDASGGRPAYVRFWLNKTTACGAASAFFVSGGITVFILYLGAYLGEHFGLSVTQIGLVFLLSGAASLGGALAAGPLSDRYGKKPLAVGGSLMLALVVLVVSFLEGGVALYAFLGLTGLAAASRVAPLQSLVTELVSRESRAAYIAMRNTLSQLGIAASSFVGAGLYARGGFARVCQLAAVLSVVAALVLWLIEEPASGKGSGASQAEGG